MQILSYSEAKASGAIRYFTGKACRRGHVAERLAVNGFCCECARIKAREQYWVDKAAGKTATPEFIEKRRARSRRFKAHAKAMRPSRKPALTHEETKARRRQRYRMDLEWSREQAVEHQKEWRTANPEAAKRIDRASYWRNREKKLAASRLRHAEKREVYRANARVARKTNKELRERDIRRCSARAGFRRAGYLGGVSEQAISALLQEQAGLCVYCLSIHERLTVDHVEAINSGGAHTLENLVGCCRRCNGMKQDRHLLLFLADLHGRPIQRVV